MGKTCLVDRYLNGKFRDTTSPVPPSFCPNVTVARPLPSPDGISKTVGAAFGAKKVDIGDGLLTVGVWYFPPPSILHSSVCDVLRRGRGCGGGGMPSDAI